MKATGKYIPYTPIQNLKRTWPDKATTCAPIWCSVDLRDGNQALITPMSAEEKLGFFNLLIKIGFKEIEVGFPSAAQVEYDFCRKLIEENIIPADVRIQVLVQSRKHLIEKTVAAVKGAKKPIVHLYNPTSTNQRKIVFRKEQKEIIDIALQGVRWIKECAAKAGTKVTLEYSPESFTGTEPDFALQISNAVIAEWGPTPDNKMILNLPATIELSTPNIYADYIEWMSTKLDNRSNVILSVHAHNDRGTAVVASELALLAGADRVEGTLFGNGERTGNVDIVTMALNMFTQGVDSMLDFSNINDIISVVEKINRIPVHVRQPYSGQLVYTAFSGSHQDAIKKGLDYQKDKNDALWEVPYLPIDPQDVGRNYEGIIRINSQSGKGGVAYVMEKEFGYILPKEMHPEFARTIQAIADKTGREISSSEIFAAFEKEYIQAAGPIEFISFQSVSDRRGLVEGKLNIRFNGEKKILSGKGNGPLDACENAFLTLGSGPFNISSYHEHSLEHGSTSRAVAYIELEKQSGKSWGIGIDTSITQAAVKALICAINRAG